MPEKFKQTVKIARPSKVTTDDRGRTVWVDPVETAKLELVSTQMLRQIIDSDDVGTKDRIREAAEGKDGLLAHDTDNDSFEIISDDELQQILDDNPELPDAKKLADIIHEPLTEAVGDDDELELVSTRMLRRMFSPEDGEQASEDESTESGFDPYNKV